MRGATDARGLAGSSPRRVGLLAAPRRPPRTCLEGLLLSTLRVDGAMPLEDLVQRVARTLYVDALGQGAWTVDIGVFGSEVFVPEVVRGLEEGDGTLWEIAPADPVR